MKTKRIAVATAAAVGLVAPLGLAIGPAHADSDAGYVIGTVVDNAGHPVPDADVTVTSTSGDSESAGTDRNGRYVIGVYGGEIADGGTWTITASAGGFTSSTARAIAAPVVAHNTAGPTIGLAPEAATADPAGAVLTGVVTTPYGAAHSGYVEADDATGRDVDYAQIGPDGRYYFYGSDTDIAGKAVRLEFYVDGFLSTFDGGVVRENSAPLIAVPTSGAPRVVNGAVTAEGTIVGAVKLPAAGANWGASVTVFDTDGNIVNTTGQNGSYGESAYGGTDAAGNFSIDVPPGTYYVRADGSTWKSYTAPGSTSPEEFGAYNFVAGYYGGKKAVSLATAKKIVVGAGSTKSVGTITLTNAYHVIDKPTITVKKGIKKGGKIKVTHGAWNHTANTVYTYAWKVGKKTVGTKATLKLTKKVWKKKLKNGKKAKKLTVTVTASDKYGHLVNGSSKQKVIKTLAKEQKAAAKAAKKAQKQAKKVDKKTKH